MPTYAYPGALGPSYLNCCIPPNPAAVGSFSVFVTREIWFILSRNRVDVRGGERGWNGHVFAACGVEHGKHDIARAICTPFFDQVVQ